MCNDYAREIELGRVTKLMKEMESLPPFEWEDGRIPNDQEPKPSIKIRDQGLIVRLEGAHLIGSMKTWGWKTPQGKPVFNFVSEGRDFSKSDRVLILATGFYEYTAPENPKIKLKDKHLFRLQGFDWFWVAGIVKQGCFTMLTTAPGPDMTPYHDRQICVLTPDAGNDWLILKGPERELFAIPPKGTFEVTSLRKNGQASSF